MDWMNRRRNRTTDSSSLRTLAVMMLLLPAALPRIASAQAANNALDIVTGAYVDGLSANANLPQADDPRTIEAWINPRSGQSGTVMNYGTFAENQRFGLLYIAQRLYLVGELHDVQGSTTIPTGQWTHVAIAYDGTAAVPRLYVNGVLETGTPLYSTGPFDTVGGSWRLGEGVGINYVREPFDGAIDEVKVWMYARSASQIRFDMLAESCATQGLVAYYDFNAGTAGGDNTSITTLLDRSGSGAHGSLVQFQLAGPTSNFVSGAPVCRATGSHGDYVACVDTASATLADHGKIVSAAARSSCGK
jgi:Concanavalin A-like lectin/glucanases superfamily